MLRPSSQGLARNLHQRLRRGFHSREPSNPSRLLRAGDSHSRPERLLPGG
ncbi:hypothetical protein PSEUDO8O_30847 [Pseudomonas sp. 8O]|nr:hypothetical protein PSEUDO8O_30847 [Pseudomonas sp. 8O]